MDIYEASVNTGFWLSLRSNGQNLYRSSIFARIPKSDPATDAYTLMATTDSGCCSQCGERISTLSFFFASLHTRMIWSASCSNCGARNYIHPLANALLLFFAVFIAILSGIFIISIENPKWLGVGAAILLFPLIRGVLSYVWLRFGRFRATN